MVLEDRHSERRARGGTQHKGSRVEGERDHKTETKGPESVERRATTEDPRQEHMHNT